MMLYSSHHGRIYVRRKGTMSTRSFTLARLSAAFIGLALVAHFVKVVLS